MQVIVLILKLKVTKNKHQKEKELSIDREKVQDGQRAKRKEEDLVWGVVLYKLK